MKVQVVCPACGAEIEGDLAPGEAFACPGCGASCIAPSAPRVALVRKRRRWIVPAVVLGVLLAPILLAVLAGLRAPRPVPPVQPIARPARPAPSAPAATTTTRPPASPWKVSGYYTPEGKQAKRVTCESVVLGGRVVVAGDASALAWIIVPTYPMPRVNPGVEWPLGVGHGADVASAAELRRERWTIRDGKLVLADPSRGLDLARALVALPESESIVLPYPTSDGKTWAVVLPVRGLRDALRQLAPSL